MKQFSGEDVVQPEMGSTILFGAINDLDLGEAKIPGYTPPGMSKKSDNSEGESDPND